MRFPPQHHPNRTMSIAPSIGGISTSFALSISNDYDPYNGHIWVRHFPNDAAVWSCRTWSTSYPYNQQWRPVLRGHSTYSSYRPCNTSQGIHSSYIMMDQCRWRRRRWWWSISCLIQRRILNNYVHMM